MSDPWCHIRADGYYGLRKREFHRLLADADALLRFKEKGEAFYADHTARINNGLDVPVPLNEWLASLPKHLRRVKP